MITTITALYSTQARDTIGDLPLASEYMHSNTMFTVQDLTILKRKAIGLIGNQIMIITVSAMMLGTQITVL